MKATTDTSKKSNIFNSAKRKPAGINLVKAADPQEAPAPAEAEAQGKGAAMVRVPMMISEGARTQLRVHAAETGKRQTEILREALNDYFTKVNKLPIA